MLRTISEQTCHEAVEILKHGGLVAIPTETVYGLAADASNPEAIKKIYAAKGRPADHPIIVHIADIDQLPTWAKDIPDSAYKLANAFWPGPMTLILKKSPEVSPLITANQDTVGIRIPNHPIAKMILENFGGGIGAPSANSFGQISPSLSSHVEEDLGEKVDMIIDGGICSVGIESTIINCTDDQPKILRPGMITPEMIFEETGLKVIEATKNEPKVSGSLESHYAPKTKSRLLSQTEIDELISAKNKLDKVILIVSRRLPQTMQRGIQWLKMPEDASAYAHCLYEKMHEADSMQCSEIIFEDVPNDHEWAGIKDRLTRACN